jgi:hypothetical protein
LFVSEPSSWSHFCPEALGTIIAKVMQEIITNENRVDLSIVEPPNSFVLFSHESRESGET